MQNHFMPNMIHCQCRSAWRIRVYTTMPHTKPWKTRNKPRGPSLQLNATAITYAPIGERGRKNRVDDFSQDVSDPIIHDVKIK